MQRVVRLRNGPSGYASGQGLGICAEHIHIWEGDVLPPAQSTKLKIIHSLNEQNIWFSYILKEGEGQHPHETPHTLKHYDACTGYPNFQKMVPWYSLQHSCSFHCSVIKLTNNLAKYVFTVSAWLKQDTASKPVSTLFFIAMAAAAYIVINTQ